MARLAVSTFILITSLGTASFAQTAEQQAEQRAREEFLRDVNAIGRRTSQSGGPGGFGSKRATQDLEKFSAAVVAFRAAVDAQERLEKPLKELRSASANLERYSRPLEPAKIDKSPFAKLSRAELVKETLRAGELIKADLLGLTKINEDPLLLRSVEAARYLREFYGELQRLQFLIDKTQSAK